MTDMLQKVFDQATAEELTLLLDEHITAEEPDQLTAARITRSVKKKIKTAAGLRSPWKRAAAAAAVTVIVLGGGVYGIAAEAKEYHAAVSFFQENGLCSDGLSRREIKAVYRDISSRSFTYEETGRVISHSVSTVSGYEISAQGFTPEQLALLWQRQNATVGVEYTAPMERLGVVNGSLLVAAPYLEKHENGRLVWRTEFPTTDIAGCVAVAEGVVVYGTQWDWRAILAGDTPASPAKPRIGKTDFEGNALWTKPADNGFAQEYIYAGLENPDGGFTLFSIGYAMTDEELIASHRDDPQADTLPENPKTLCVARYSANGEQISLGKAPLPGYAHAYVQKAIHFADGYLLKCTLLEDGATRQSPVLLKINNAGQIDSSFAYEGGDTLCFIEDMIEYGGQIYLSGYTVPRGDSDKADGEWDRFRDEIYALRNEIFLEDRQNHPEEYERLQQLKDEATAQKGHYSNQDLDEMYQTVFDKTYYEYVSALMEAMGEERQTRLTRLLQENYTALLLRCEATAGTPQKFYSAPGGIGGPLARQADGTLLWGVAQIAGGKLGEGIKSGSGYQALGYRHNYSFDAAGSLVSQEQTDYVMTHQILY